MNIKNWNILFCFIHQDVQIMVTEPDEPTQPKVEDDVSVGELGSYTVSTEEMLYKQLIQKESNQ